MPPGDEVTVPPPVPSVVTLSELFSANVAVTAASALTVIVHGPVPVQPPPDQPMNDDVPSAAAVSVTVVPTSKSSEQSEPQLMPPGEDDTVPPPPPASVTITVAVGVTGASGCAVSTLPQAA